ncbi:g6435 [Coccomyxa viridis]|uniref:G6435 protein n=1 Tax=Coccomyxa viridis TaxID=1274662 RepID=A0ABP1G0D3_9CHLO
MTPLEEAPTSRGHARKSEADPFYGVKAASVFWLAELGKAGNISQFSRVNNNVDFCNTCISIARQLDWSSGEKEVALYDSPHAHYSEWLEICPVVEGWVQFSSRCLFDVTGRRGGHHTLPLGIAPGSMLRDLMERMLR